LRSAARALQLLGLVVTGLAFFTGVLGRNERLELVLLGFGAALFFLGRWMEKRAG
jgi:hypothetical protein